jgi:hypothetical protein
MVGRAEHDRRDQLALQIEQRLEELESTGTWRQAADLYQQQAEPSAMVNRVARYENDAERLGALALNDAARAPAHLAHQAVGDELRDQLAAMPAGDGRELLERRLDAADLVADRPFIEAVSGMTVEDDRLAAAALADASDVLAPTVSADVIRAEMATEDAHAALRADVLSAVVAAGHDPAELRGEIEQHGVDLTRMAPALRPAAPRGPCAGLSCCDGCQMSS